jgi:hypothetical protein
VWLANGEGNGPGEYTIAMETEAKCQQIVSDMRVELESKGVTMEIKRDCFYWDGTEQQYIEEYGKSRSI